MGFHRILQQSLFMRFRNIAKPHNGFTNSPLWHCIRSMSVLTSHKLQYHNKSSYTPSRSSNSKLISQWSSWTFENCLILQPLGPTWNRETPLISPTNSCGPPTFHTSFQFFQQLSNPLSPYLSPKRATVHHVNNRMLPPVRHVPPRIGCLIQHYLFVFILLDSSRWLSKSL
jgi:hypothetical protein